MATISEIMTQKAKGESNAVGDKWGDHNCAIAAGTIEALVAALEAVQSDGKKYRSVMSGTTLAAVDAALALARGEG